MARLTSSATRSTRSRSRVDCSDPLCSAGEGTRNEMLPDPDEDQLQETWRIVTETVPHFSEAGWDERPAADNLLGGDLDRHLATVLLRRRWANRSYVFLPDY